MHQQISGSPDDTASNMAAVVEALAGAKVNIEGIGPAYEAPHVRIAVKHKPKYDPSDPDDPHNIALEALRGVGLDPETRPAVTARLPNHDGALKAALDVLAGQGYAVESILVLAEHDNGSPQVQFGVSDRPVPDWEAESNRLKKVIEGA